ncbi:kinesin-like protein KIF26A isoform X2 [Linepithema humile]|uniref:kinesin-like protein KIF26A isoform X2 n=1 Tax=Linepithema humile TaxID=83485 RepID=UPI00351E00BC
MEVRTERPRTAGRIAPTGRVTPTVHQTGGGRRKAIPVPPPRVPTPMPTANNNQQRNNANIAVPPTVSAVSKKEPHENIARIAKRYLDDNMQQAWINPRLISMINMEAVTSTDYDSTNLSRNFNQVGFNTYNYSQFEEKYKPRQIFKYGDEYLEYGHRLGANERFARSKYQDGTRFDQRYLRSHSQPERQHHLSQETRSKSQDSRELTFYQIDPPVKLENSTRQHDKSHQKLKKELTFYEIDGPPPTGQERREKSEVCKERGDKGTKSHDKFHAGGQERSQTAKHGRQEQQKTLVNALNRSQSDLTECQLPNYYGHRNNPYIDPPKYRQFDRLPRYQEIPPRSEPPPKYHVDPPKYTEVSRRQDDFKRIQEERGRRQGSGGGGGSGGGNSGAGRGNTGTHGAETPSNLASITPTAREATRTVIARQRLPHKTCDVRISNTNNNNNDNNSNSKENLLQDTGDDCNAPLSSRCHVEALKSHHHHYHHQQQQAARGIGGSNVAAVVIGNALPDGGGGSCGEVTTCDKYKGTGSESNRGGSSDAVQGRLTERSMLKIEKLSGKAALHSGESAVGKCGVERMKSTSQETGYNKHEAGKGKSHDVGHGYKVENLRYYGELKSYADYKAYSAVDKQLVSAHEKSHLHHPPSSCEKGDKCHGKVSSSSSSSAQGYSLAKIGQQQSDKSHHSADHYYHRSSHLKPPSAYQVYQETKYSYNVSGVPGTPAQASAAAAFFARAAQKLNLSSSPHRRRRSGDENIGSDELPIFPNGYAALLLKSPPPAPPALLRRIGVKELTGVGKVKVMLRVSPGDGGSFFNADKRKKQVTLVDPTSGQSSSAEDRRPTVAAPKMFAFDAIFTEEDSQTEICSSALTDVIHAVINGTDGCLFCFGHAGLGKSHTMLGTPEAGHTLGAIPCAIAWLFRGISEQRQRTGARFSVRVSCVELTTGQQQLRDLLAAHANDSEQSPAVYLRDDPLFGTLQLQQHSELRAPTAERAAFYLDAAVAGRQREDGDAHMLYTLHVYQYSVAGKGGVAGGRSRLHLMDLGNSDRGKSSGGIPLSGLGNILLAIFNGQKHLPYKEHKLTQLLKECLSSLTCHAAMIAHVSPNAQHYTETLTTVQLASRIHRMRRRKIKFVGSGTQGTGSGGSSGEEAARQNSECDPSSSDLSADTVIYVGPSADDATDGEHPPVYIPSLNSGDNRCVMGRVLRGSAAERPSKIPEERSPAHKSKTVKTLTQTASKQTSPAHSATPKASPARKNSSSKSGSASKINDSPGSKIPVAAPSGGSDEQWIDGPRISKSKVAEARHLLKDSHHKRETWIDGPMQLTGAPALQLHAQHQHASSGYGFMDSHKKSMIRKWVENQSSQIQRAKHAAPRLESSKPSSGQSSGQFKELTQFKTCGGAEDDDTSLSTVESDSLKANEIEDITEKLSAKLNLLNVKSNTDSGLDLTASPVMDDSIEKGKLDLPEDEDDDEEIVVPPPLPLIEPLSNGVSREVSMESLNLSHKDIVLPSRHSLSSEDEILEIVEVEDLEPVPMQDSCLQVTEEDIALCMGENPLPESDQEEHPLRILSQENLTVVSTFTDSMSVMSDTERYRPHYPPPVGAGVLPRPYFDHEDFLEQETRHKFDQLARLHELYQNKLALANVSNSVTYQRENSSTVNVRDAPSTVFRPPSRCQSLSLSDVLFNDNASNHGSIYSEPAYIAGKPDQEKICDNCRQSMSRPATASYWYPSSVAHLASPRRYCGKLGDCNISNLRHPDGASNPNLKEEIERIPGNGASGSDPEEEYIEAKKLFTAAERSERTVTGKSDIEEDLKIQGGTPLQLPMPSSSPSSGRMQRKILSLGSSFGLNKEGSDSGADTTPRAAKLSPATLSRHRAESSGYDSVVRDSETSSIASDSSRQTGALQEHQAVERRAVGCGPRRSRAHCRAQPGPPAASAILAYTGEDVDILDRRARVRSNPRGTMSRIHNLRLRQRLLRLELRDAKRRLMVPDCRWDYNLYVEDSMDWRDPSFLEALTAETCILQKRVEACKSHILLVTCFDSCPQQPTSAEIKTT